MDRYWDEVQAEWGDPPVTAETVADERLPHFHGAIRDGAGLRAAEAVLRGDR